MNVQDLHQTITKKFAHKAAEILDSSAYAYVTFQLQEIKEQGLNPMDYEVIFARDEYPQYTEDKLLVTNRIRLVKIKDIENLPVVGEEQK